MGTQKRFRLFRIMFNVGGTPLGRDGSSLLFKLYAIGTIFVLYVFWLAIAIDLVMNIDDFQYTLKSAKMTVTLIALLFVDVFLRVRKRAMDRLVGLTDEFMWEDCPKRKIGSGELTVAGLIPRIEKIAFTLCWGTVLSHSVYMGSRVFQSKTLLGVDAWFPFDTRPSPVHEVIYIIQIWQDALNCNKFCGFLGLYATLVSIACTQLDKVRLALMNYRKEIDQKEDDINKEILRGKSENQEIEEAKLRECVLLHQKVLSFMETMETTLNPILFGHFLIIVCGICFVVLSIISNLDDFGQIFEALILFVSFMTQLGVYCWFGTQLTVQAEMIKEAAWGCEWIGAPLVQQRALVFMAAAANKEFTLTAGGFITVSKTTMITVLNQTYSFTMFLLNMR